MLKKKRGGPVTAAGKSKSAVNALVHGCRSSAPVIRGERVADWRAHLAAVIDDLRPVGQVETGLVEAIALTLWRQRRVWRYELAAAKFTETSFRRKAVFDPHVLPEDVEPLAVLPANGFLRKTMRYEAHLSRQLQRSLSMLRDLQSARAGTQVRVSLHRVIVEQRPGDGQQKLPNETTC